MTTSPAILLFSLHDTVQFRRHLSKPLEAICQPLEPPDDGAADVTMPPPPGRSVSQLMTVPDEKRCTPCSRTFETRAEQIEHFRGDWHRLNVKRKLKGGPTLNEEQFEQLGSDCESISASDDDDDDENVGDRTEIVFDAGKLLFMNAQGSVVEISRTLLKAKHESVTSADLLARVAALEDLWLALIIISGGHFAAAVYHNGRSVRHKTFHQYTVRRKQGGSQSSHDNQGQFAKSAGASLRRYNEKTLTQKSQDCLKSWPELDKCSVVLIRAIGSNRAILFGGNDPVFQKNDARVRTIPMITRRPTLNELDRVYGVLTTVKVVREPTAYYETRKVSTVKTPKSEVKKRKDHSGKVGKDCGDDDDDGNDEYISTSTVKPVIAVGTQPRELIGELFAACRDDDLDELQAIAGRAEKAELVRLLATPLDDVGNSVAHFCCRRGRLAILKWLLQFGADPTITNRDGQAPYDVATNDQVRQELIAFRLANPDMWDYARAKIPVALPPPPKSASVPPSSTVLKARLKTRTGQRDSKDSKSKFNREEDLLKRLTDTMRSCEICKNEFRTVPLEADGRTFCSVNCVRTWRFS